METILRDYYEGCYTVPFVEINFRKLTKFAFLFSQMGIAYFML